MNVAQCLIFLSDPDRMAEFLGAIEQSMFDEWDCDLVTAAENFWNEEWAIAAKTAGLNLLGEKK